MKVRALMLCLAFTLVLGFAAGCAKKRVESSAPSAAVAEQMQEQQSKEKVRLEEEARLRQEQQLKEEALEAERKAEEQKQQQEFKAAMTDLGNLIHFDFDSFEIKPEYRDLLQQKAEILKKFDNVSMVIEGYCDERGTEEYNLALGERRARAVYEFLILLGVEPQRLSVVSFGEEKPLDPAHNETAWAQNRRVQFNLNYN
ncbi:peptidoglycan-associated lipoprotein Pal [Maridesulfovibrio bastinii]|uniref:peptidoglycan-associated lipoprotein Pal n=1 Tax=Maridesulfovibrio bastinii TaxID=47157 RepID=UPI000402B48D|nr:peptidoglycan-associated lipoprotein Pal [Maridesulfovibrio bastinii]